MKSEIMDKNATQIQIGTEDISKICNQKVYIKFTRRKR